MLLTKLRFYVKTFYKYVGFKAYLTLFLSGVAGLLDSFSIMLLVPLLAVTALESVESSGGQASDEGLITRLLLLIGLELNTSEIMLLVVLMIFLKGVFTYGSLYINATCRGILLEKIRMAIYSKVVASNYEDHLRSHSGDLTNLINEQAGRSIIGFYHLSQLGLHLVNALIYLSLSFFTAYDVTLFFLFFGGLLLIGFRSLNKVVARLSSGLTSINGLINSEFLQVVRGHRYLLATGQHFKLAPRLKTSILQSGAIQARIGRAAAITQSIREPIALILLGAVAYWQLVVVKSDVGIVLAALVLVYRAFTSIMGVQNYLQYCLEYLGGLESIDKYVSLAPKGASVQPEITANQPYLVSLNAVSFRYAGRNEDTISEVSLSIKAGEALAIVGASGSGKSTLLDLLAGVLAPTSGELRIGSLTDSKDKQNSWRENISLLTQESLIFTNSVLNNVSMKLGDDSSHTSEELEAAESAAQYAQFSKIVQGMDDGWNTLLREGGSNLSGGQRQRLSLARELYRSPKLLLLDEPTSALDPSTRRCIEESIHKLKLTTSMVLVSHSLSLVEVCDTVIVLEDGKVVERGDPKVLKNDSNSRYADLMNSIKGMA